MAEGSSSFERAAASPLSRVRQALLETTEDAPRPVTRLGLPLGVDRLLGRHWQRKLRPAAVLVPIIDRATGPHVLLTQRSQSLRDHAGQVSFPGGRVESTDISIAHAALREAEEEISLDPAASEILGYLHDYPTISRFCVTPVVARVDESATFEPDQVEVDSVFEVPLEHALNLEAYERKSIGRMGVDLPFMELLWEDWRIWGATAGMLHDLATLVDADA